VHLNNLNAPVLIVLRLASGKLTGERA